MMNRDRMRLKKKRESSRANAPSEIVPVEEVKGVNGLEKIILRQVGSSAEIYLYGAQVTSWKKEHEELLFVSSKANFSPYAAIRGGIPICFPQFLDLGPVQQHGFARNRIWCIERESPEIPYCTAIRASVELKLKPKEADLRMWPHSFEFRLRVTLSPEGDLILKSKIWNTSTKQKNSTFTFGYNNYFSVSDISKIQVEGLERLNYLDHWRKKDYSDYWSNLLTDEGNALTFEAEVDRVYLHNKSKIAIVDHKKKRTIEIHKNGIRDAAVWNPLDKKAKAMADLGNKDYKKMVCVGAAVAKNPVTLKPGEEWTGRMRVTSVNTSCSIGRLDPKKGPARLERSANSKYRMYTTWVK